MYFVILNILCIQAHLGLQSPKGVPFPSFSNLTCQPMVGILSINYCLMFLIYFQCCLMILNICSNPDLSANVLSHWTISVTYLVLMLYSYLYLVHSESNGNSSLELVSSPNI